MRHALAYSRVSSSDQAEGYSLRAQQSAIASGAARYGAVIVGHYSDDDSAKHGRTLTESFDRRPGWQNLLKQIRQHPAKRGGPTLVLLKDWSRFSRHTAAGWAMIHQLQQLGVEVQAVDQPIDWESPEHPTLVGMYLSLPEADNRRRQVSIRAGQRQAAIEGRWVRRAPVGYRPTYAVVPGRMRPERVGIEPDPEIGPLMAEAYLLATDPDVSLDSIRKQLRRPNGQPLFSSANWLSQALRRRVCLGEVLIPAGGGQPERWALGAHEAIIDRATWEAVQDRLDGSLRKPNGRQKKLKLSPDLPLRGHLLGPGGDVLTGSGSTSRHGYTVWYYHGRGKGAYRLKADEAHEALLDCYRQLSPSPGFLAVLRAVCEQEIEGRAARASIDLASARAALQAAERRQLAADEAIVDGTIPADAYVRLAASRAAAVEEATVRVEAAKGTTKEDGTRDLKALRYVLPLLTDLAGLWEASGIEGRHALVGSTFPSGLTVADGRVVEPRFGPLLSALAASTKPKTTAADPEESAAESVCGDAGSRTRVRKALQSRRLRA